MKIIVGCPIRERAWCLPQWFDGIEQQNIDVEVMCLYSPSEDATLQILQDHGAYVLTDTAPARPTHEIDSHLWGDIRTYDYMAQLRNTLTDAVIAAEADYFFSLDSDIVLPHGALESLLEWSESRPGTTSPAVNMLREGTGYAWNNMQWVSGARDSAVRYGEPQGGKADVVMAAMLLDKEGMKARWQPHHQGEDIGYSIDAANKGIDLWWLPEIKCQHLMVKH